MVLSNEQQTILLAQIVHKLGKHLPTLFPEYARANNVGDDWNPFTDIASEPNSQIPPSALNNYEKQVASNPEYHLSDMNIRNADNNNNSIVGAQMVPVMGNAGGPFMSNAPDPPTIEQKGPVDAILMSLNLPNLPGKVEHAKTVALPTPIKDDIDPEIEPHEMHLSADAYDACKNSLNVWRTVTNDHQGWNNPRVHNLMAYMMHRTKDLPPNHPTIQALHQTGGGIWSTIKNGAKKAWNYVKENPIKAALGALAVGGLAYGVSNRTAIMSGLKKIPSTGWLNFMSATLPAAAMTATTVASMSHQSGLVEQQQQQQQAMLAAQNDHAASLMHDPMNSISSGWHEISHNDIEMPHSNSGLSTPTLSRSSSFANLPSATTTSLTSPVDHIKMHNEGDDIVQQYNRQPKPVPQKEGWFDSLKSKFSRSDPNINNFDSHAGLKQSLPEGRSTKSMWEEAHPNAQPLNILHGIPSVDDFNEHGNLIRYPHEENVIGQNEPTKFSLGVKSKPKETHPLVQSVQNLFHKSHRGTPYEKPYTPMPDNLTKEGNLAGNGLFKKPQARRSWKISSVSVGKRRKN